MRRCNVVRLLLGRGASPDVRNRVRCAREPRAPAVSCLTALPSWLWQGGDTPLALAACTGSIDVMTLLTAQASCDARGSDYPPSSSQAVAGDHTVATTLNTQDEVSAAADSPVHERVSSHARLAVLWPGRIHTAALRV